MIVADTSALVAIAFDEPERERFQEILFRTGTAIVAAPTAFEYRMVVSGRHPLVRGDVEALLERFSIVPWTATHALVAENAFLRYGKGRGHRAQLNFGDCMSYALAKAEGVPLLYKGGDFALTDIRAAA